MVNVAIANMLVAQKDDPDADDVVATKLQETPPTAKKVVANRLVG